jgi:hypothetical protein
MTTSKKSDIQDAIIRKSELLVKDYNAATLNVEQIIDNLSSMFNGYGIRVLNVVQELSLGFFIFYKNGFVLVYDDDGIARRTRIDDELGCDILSKYYAVRSLSQVPKYYDKKILEYTKDISTSVKMLHFG